MAAKPPFPSFNPLSSNKLLFKLFLITLFCSLSYLLGSFSSTTTSSTTTTVADAPTSTNITTDTTTYTNTSITTFTLDFESHHSQPAESTEPPKKAFNFCPPNFTNYCPCQNENPDHQKLYPTLRFFHRERHCPASHERLTCLIPAPKGYKPTLPWPTSRAMAWFRNIPYKRLTVIKKSQNWVRLEGDKLVFPGGGTSFPQEAKGYVSDISRVLPLKSGTIRTVLDVGCGVSSFGAALLDYNILTMSIAPVDIHEAQVQFALERGLPAMLGILNTYRLPTYHTHQDLSIWRTVPGVLCNGLIMGLFMMELDRVLRPGGYWVLSGPPINWKVNYIGWQRTREDLEGEQKRLEDLLRRMCWKKVTEKGNIAVYRKPTNHVHCAKKLKAWKSPQFCDEKNPDIAWYTKMYSCITPLPDVKAVDELSGGALQKWPIRLNAIPPRIGHGIVKGISPRSFNEDNNVWKGRIRHYGRVLGSLFKGGYRNIMDMNAGLGGFAAALSPYPVWVMNTVPHDHDATNHTLGIIYERGLIGTYMNWCEAFSTYPRTYDLIHADGLFSMYKDKCDILDIAFEMYRILRPHGAVIIRDHVDTIMQVKDVARRMGWNATLSNSERGPLHPEKVLFIDNRGSLAG